MGTTFPRLGPSPLGRRAEGGGAMGDGGVRISAKLLMVIATLVSTLISFGGGLVMYIEGLAIVEDTIQEISLAEVTATARKLNATFTAAYETSRAYKNLISSWNRSLQTWEEWQDFMELDQFARVRNSADLYSAGLLVVPLEGTVANASALAQIVWWDPLTVGVPTGTRQYVSGFYLPRNWGAPSCVQGRIGEYDKYRCMIVHELHPDTGAKLSNVYNYSEVSLNNLGPEGRWPEVQRNWETEGAVWWRSPDVWVSADGTQYSYTTLQRVLPKLWHGNVIGGSGYKVTVNTYIVFDPWEGYLREADAEATLIATFLHEGLDSQPLATNRDTPLTESEGCSRDKIASGRNICLLTLRNVSATIQEACIKANHTANGYFFRTSIGGSEHWVRRLVIHPKHQFDEMETSHLVWLRPVSSVEDKLNRSLFLFIGFVAAVFVFDMIILSVEIRQIARPLELLEWAMDPVDRMDLDEGERRLACRSISGVVVVAEVERLFLRFKLSLDALREYRRFIPEGVLVQEEEEDEKQASPRKSQITSPPAGKSVRSVSFGAREELDRRDPTNPLSARASGSDGQSEVSNVRGNQTAALLGLGDWRQKRCSILMAALQLGKRGQESPAGNPGQKGLGDFVTCIVDVCQDAGGVAVSTAMWDDAMHVTFAWNALRPHPTHAARACEAALSVLHQFDGEAALAAIRPRLRIGVSSGTASIGNVGNAKMRAQVVTGQLVEHATLLTALIEPTGAAALCTHAVYEQVRSQVAARVIDAVMTASGQELLVYELVDTSLDTLENQTSFVRGVAAFRSGDCDTALREFKLHLEAHGYDKQALRLYRIAQAFKALQGESRVLLRAQQPRFISLEAAAMEIPLPEDVLALCHESVQDDPVSTVVTIEGNSTTPRRRPTQSEAEMLKEQIREAYAHIADADAAASTTGQHLVLDDALPNIFKDARGIQYHRSDKSLGRGAFGQVWLGMSPNGSMVAVKSIRLRAPVVADGNDHGNAHMLGTTDTADGGWTVTPASVSGSPRPADHANHAEDNLAWTVTAASPRADDAARSSAEGATAPLSSVSGPGAGDAWANESPEPGLPGSPRAGIPHLHAAAGAERRPSYNRSSGENSMANSKSFVSLSAPGATMARRQITELIQEVALMIALKHENVVQFLGCAVENAHVLMVMEYLPGGSLAGVLSQFGGKLPISCIRRFTHDMVSGLKFIHAHKPPIVHRDLKPANVLMTIEGQCKLADFGASAELKQAADGGDDGPVGTPMYMPPEQTRGLATTASDIWSLGIVVSELCTGRVPWGPINNPFGFMRRLSKDPNMVPAVPDTVADEDCRNFIASCAQRDAKLRPSARRLLNHAFLLS
eukprot:TRINITY_DN7723_c0_g5_i1.p1 TRINITY_DN7723_c0_g5~~TRINITY_DN7723_c0_g5_i1.p1  ORF type:complete len:1351 (+),score=370.05 TRINITY_DN7723_c0_g5_i1:41-4093(+)